MRCMWNLVTLILLSAKPNQTNSAWNVTQLPRFGFLFFPFPPTFPTPSNASDPQGLNSNLYDGDGLEIGALVLERAVVALLRDGRAVVVAVP